MIDRIRYVLEAGAVRVLLPVNRVVGRFGAALKNEVSWLQDNDVVERVLFGTIRSFAKYAALLGAVMAVLVFAPSWVFLTLVLVAVGWLVLWLGYTDQKLAVEREQYEARYGKSVVSEPLHAGSDTDPERLTIEFTDAEDNAAAAFFRAAAGLDPNEVFFALGNGLPMPTTPRHECVTGCQPDRHIPSP